MIHNNNRPILSNYPSGDLNPLSELEVARMLDNGFYIEVYSWLVRKNSHTISELYNVALCLFAIEEYRECLVLLDKLIPKLNSLTPDKISFDRRLSKLFEKQKRLDIHKKAVTYNYVTRFATQFYDSVIRLKIDCLVKEKNWSDVVSNASKLIYKNYRNVEDALEKACMLQRKCIYEEKGNTENVFLYLDKANIKYEIRHPKVYFPQEEINKFNSREEDIIPHNLFLKDRSEKIYCLIVADFKTVSLKELQAKTGLTSLSFASEDHLKAKLHISARSASILNIINDYAKTTSLLVDKSLITSKMIGIYLDERTTVWFNLRELLTSLESDGVSIYYL